MLVESCDIKATMSPYSDLKPFPFRRNARPQKLHVTAVLHSLDFTQSQARKGRSNPILLTCKKSKYFFTINQTFVFCITAETWGTWKMRKTISIWMIAKIQPKGVSYWDLLILLSKCCHFTQNWVLFGLIYLKIKLIYNQFFPHLNSDLQVFLQGSVRIREIRCCLSCSLEQNASQTCAYGAGCFRDHTNTFTLLYIFLLISNLCVPLARN